MRRLFLSVGLLLAGAPVFLLAGAALTPGVTPVLWLLPAALAVAGAAAARLLPRRGRVPGLLAAMACAAISALLLGGWLDAGIWKIMPAALAAGLCALHLWLLSQGRGGVPVTLWYSGGLLYFAARIVGAMSALTALPGPLTACALIYFIYMMFALTLQSLWDGMGGGSAPSRRMTVRNLTMAGALALILAAATHLRLLGEWIHRAAEAVVMGVLWLMDRLGSLFMDSGGAGEGAGGGMDLSGLVEDREPSLLLVILEKIAYVLGILLAAALAVWLLIQAGKALIRGVRRLIERLRAYAGAVSDAYEDTVESLLDWGEVRRALGRRARTQKEAEEPWERQSPRQRVRSSYRAFLARHPDLPAGRTARQAVDDARLSAIYEAARYSSREITPEEAEESRDLRKK